VDIVGKQDGGVCRKAWGVCCRQHPLGGAGQQGLVDPFFFNFLKCIAEIKNVDNF